MTTLLILKYWKLVGVGLLIVALGVLLHARDAALVAKGKAEAESAQRSLVVQAKDQEIATLRKSYDSVKAISLKSQDRVLRLLVHDTVQTWRHDTVTVNGEKRIEVPIPEVARTDSLQTACYDNAINCAVRASVAEKLNDSLSAEIFTLKQPRPVAQKSCATQDIIWGGIGGLAGFFLHR